MVTDVIVGHSILHIIGPKGQPGNVSFMTTSEGIQSRATVRSATARFTRRKFRVVRIRGVRIMTRQTSVLPMKLTRNIAANMMYCSVSIHFDVVPESSLLRLPFIVELETVMLNMAEYGSVALDF